MIKTALTSPEATLATETVQKSFSPQREAAQGHNRKFSKESVVIMARRMTVAITQR